MGYFAGLGAGKGWSTFNFILTPKEFQEIFDRLTYAFIKTGTRVENDYIESNKKDIFEGYEIFFNQILIGQTALTKEKAWSIERVIRVSVTDNIDKVSFRVCENEKKEILPFKVLEPTEPVINIAPFYLSWSVEQEKMSVAYFDTKGVIGLQLSFPKYVSFNYSDYVETSVYKTAELYDILISRIKEISKKAKVETPIKLYKPNFWISTNAIQPINQNRYLKENKLKIQ